MREHTTLQLLLESRTLKDAKRVVNMLVGMGFGWMPLGEKEGNFGLVNIGSDPGFAFIERITNALDALIDEAACRVPPAVVAELSSPRAAVAALFAIPEGRTIHLAPERQAQIAREVTSTTFVPTIRNLKNALASDPKQYPKKSGKLKDARADHLRFADGLRYYRRGRRAYFNDRPNRKGEEGF